MFVSRFLPDPFLTFVYSSFDLNVCLLDWLGNMWISCLCLYSSADLSPQNQSELVLRDSPQFSYIRSLCLTVLHLHCEFLGTPCVDPFCRKPLLNTRRYLWCFQPLECPDFHHILLSDLMLWKQFETSWLTAETDSRLVKLMHQGDLSTATPSPDCYWPDYASKCTRWQRS